MSNFSSPFDNHMDSVFLAFRNLYLQSYNKNSVGKEDNNYRDRGFALTCPPPLPLNPNLFSHSPTVASPITPPEISLLSRRGESPRTFGNAHNTSFFHDDRFKWLFEMMTCSRDVYQFHRLLDRCSKCLLLSIANRVTLDPATFLGLANHPEGSAALRSLLKRSDSVNELIFATVCNNFFDLMISKYGHYLIIPTLRAVDRSKKEELYALAADNTLKLATQEIGCASLNDFLQEMRGFHRDRLLSIVASNALWLSQDPYGNFVVQNVLKLQNPSLTREIASKLHGEFARLSVQRFGSYIVELCLKSPVARDFVLDEFIKNREGWIRVAKDKFGNFVAQSTLKILKELDSPAYEELVKKLKPHYEEMRRGHGRNAFRIIQTQEERRTYRDLF